MQQILVERYPVGAVKISTSDKEDGPWDEMMTEFPKNKINLEKKNKRFLKLEFSNIANGFVGIYELRVYIPESETPPAGLEHTEEKGVMEDSTDITNSLFINPRAISGTFDKFPITAAYTNDETYWCSADKTGDQWVIFDVNLYGIDGMEIRQHSQYFTEKLTVHTSDECDLSEGIKCIDSSASYKGYPIENMYNLGTANENYWCSLDDKEVYLTFDCGEIKISQFHMVCIIYYLS